MKFVLTLLIFVSAQAFALVQQVTYQCGVTAIYQGHVDFPSASEWTASEAKPFCALTSQVPSMIFNFDGLQYWGSIPQVRVALTDTSCSDSFAKHGFLNPSYPDRIEVTSSGGGVAQVDFDLTSDKKTLRPTKLTSGNQSCFIYYGDEDRLKLPADSKQREQCVSWGHACSSDNDCCAGDYCTDQHQCAWAD